MSGVCICKILRKKSRSRSDPSESSQTRPLLMVSGFCVRCSLLQNWSVPKIIFVFLLHKHLFVFVRVIQFVCGPRIKC